MPFLPDTEKLNTLVRYLTRHSELVIIVLVSRHLEDTFCGLGLGIAQWSCLHVIDVNEVN